MNATAVDRMFERIMSIDFRNVDRSRYESHAKLFREHERRVAQWSKALGFPIEAQPVMWDIASVIVPSVAVDKEKTRALTAKLKHPYTLKTCLNALGWAAIEESPEVQPYNLPAPYEPLIVLFERGGDISKDELGRSWFVTRGTLIQSMHKFYDRTTPIVELDPAVLDAIDAEADQ